MVPEHEAQVYEIFAAAPVEIALLRAEGVKAGGTRGRHLAGGDVLTCCADPAEVPLQHLHLASQVSASDPSKSAVQGISARLLGLGAGGGAGGGA